MIDGIQQIDHTNHQAQVDFIEGGIGSKKVIMQVSAPKGSEIGTEFHFYGRKVNFLYFFSKDKTFFNQTYSLLS